MNRHITVGLGMVAGAALGATALQTLHAQTKPPAYNIAEITIKDQDGYNKEYLPLITKALTEAGGKFLVRGGKTISYEGAAPATRACQTKRRSIAWKAASQLPPNSPRRIAGKSAVVTIERPPIHTTTATTCRARARARPSI